MEYFGAVVDHRHQICGQEVAGLILLLIKILCLFVFLIILPQAFTGILSRCLPSSGQRTEHFVCRNVYKFTWSTLVQWYRTRFVMKGCGFNPHADQSGHVIHIA